MLTRKEKPTSLRQEITEASLCQNNQQNNKNTQKKINKEVSQSITLLGDLTAQHSSCLIFPLKHTLSSQDLPLPDDMEIIASSGE